MIKVLFVCLGNICRSPMAEFIFKDMVKKRGLENEFCIDSAATDGYNEAVKEGLYYEAKKILDEMKVPYTEHYSRQIRKSDYDKFDYIFGMEERNIRNIVNIVGKDTEGKISRLLDFTNNPRDIIDPWYYGNFDSVYYDIIEGCEAFLQKLGY